MPDAETIHYTSDKDFIDKQNLYPRELLNKKLKQKNDKIKFPNVSQHL